jgi:hypothetical protein
MKPHVKRLIAHYLLVKHGLCKRRNVGEDSHIELGSYKRPCEAFVMHMRVGYTECPKKIVALAYANA